MVPTLMVYGVPLRVCTVCDAHGHLLYVALDQRENQSSEERQTEALKPQGCLAR